MMESYTILSLLLCLSVTSVFSNNATPACQEDPTGVKYRGNLSQTINGHTCQAWTSQYPHQHDRTPANYPNAGLDENYCRNPDNVATAWCYTTNPGIRWKYCAVGYLDPRCQVVRLAGSGRSTNQGRVEVFAMGQWGTVCHDSWGQTNADVVCKQLGFPGASSFMQTFGPGSVPIMLDNVSCVGSETSIMDCRKNRLWEHDCSHSEDAGVVCRVDQVERRRVEELELYEEKVAAEEASDDKKDADLKKKDVLQALYDLLAELKD